MKRSELVEMITLFLIKCLSIKVNLKKPSRNSLLKNWHFKNNRCVLVFLRCFSLSVNCCLFAVLFHQLLKKVVSSALIDPDSTHISSALLSESTRVETYDDYEDDYDLIISGYHMLSGVGGNGMGIKRASTSANRLVIPPTLEDQLRLEGEHYGSITDIESRSVTQRQLNKVREQPRSQIDEGYVS